MVSQGCMEKKRMWALIVDDELLTRRVHGMILTRLGLETDAVENGKEAVDLFASGKCYDIVFMDMEMPVIDGRKATEELRGMGVSSMKVGVTACRLEAAKESFMMAGLDYSWEKPQKTDRVSGLLDELATKLI